MTGRNGGPALERSRLPVREPGCKTSFYSEIGLPRPVYVTLCLMKRSETGEYPDVGLNREVKPASLVPVQEPGCETPFYSEIGLPRPVYVTLCLTNWSETGEYPDVRLNREVKPATRVPDQEPGCKTSFYSEIGLPKTCLRDSEIVRSAGPKIPRTPGRENFPKVY